MEIAAIIDVVHAGVSQEILVAAAGLGVAGAGLSAVEVAVQGEATVALPASAAKQLEVPAVGQRVEAPAQRKELSARAGSILDAHSVAVESPGVRAGVAGADSGVVVDAGEAVSGQDVAAARENPIIV